MTSLAPALLQRIPACIHAPADRLFAVEGNATETLDDRTTY